MTDTPAFAQYPFQAEGSAFLRRVERGMLGDVPRLGKTNQLLMAAEGRTLAITPAHLEGVWEDEFLKWKPDCELYWVSYGGVCRRKADKRGRMSMSERWPKDDLKGPWDTVILDESHNVKNPKAYWTDAIQRIKCDRIYLATGTPIPNWAHELIIPLRLMFPGDPRFTDRWRWIKRWFKTWQPPWGGTKIGDLLDECTWAEFHQANGLNDRLLLRSEADVGMQLPPLEMQQIDCSMEPEQARVYKALKKDYIAWVESTGAEICAWSDGGLHTKLGQLTTGLELIDPGARSSGKLSLVTELIRERPGVPLVLGCVYRATALALQRIAESLHRRPCVIMGGVADRKGLVRRFQAGEFDTLIGTLESISEGLDFSNASTAIRVERSWNPARNVQFEQRMRALGKTTPCLVIDLFCRDTLDRNMSKVLAGKTEQQAKALPAGAFASAL